MVLFDAHCHLLTDADLRTALNAGVRGLVVNAVRPDDWTRVADMAATRAGVFGALGVHPWCVAAGDGLQRGRVPHDWAVRLRDILAAHPDLMVGEVGLDKTRPDIAAQADVFNAHLQIAHDLGRTVHVHCVGAWGMMADILQVAPRVPAIVFHGFSGAPDIMPQLARYNAYFSFGAGVMNPHRTRVRTAATNADARRILVESDAPDSGLSPADLATVVAQIAALRGCDATGLADMIYENSTRVVQNG